MPEATETLGSSEIEEMPAVLRRIFADLAPPWKTLSSMEPLEGKDHPASPSSKPGLTILSFLEAMETVTARVDPLASQARAVIVCGPSGNCAVSKGRLQTVVPEASFS